VLALIGVVAGTFLTVALLPDDAGTAAVQSPTRPPADGPAPTTGDGPAAGATQPEAPTMPDVARRDPEDPLTAGPVDAPVVMTVYSDYQCPFCAVWSDRTLPELQSYVDAGQLRIEWRDANVFGPDSTRAAEGAYAAALQGRFWDFHHALVEGGEKPGPDEISEEGLVDLAGRLGLDVDRFAADLASPEVAAAVQANADEAAAIGAFSTPSFIVGSTPIVGAQPTEVFVAAIEEELGRAAG
jgi:protein-disulfide isomerase